MTHCSQPLRRPRVSKLVFYAKLTAGCGDIRANKDLDQPTLQEKKKKSGDIRANKDLDQPTLQEIKKTKQRPDSLPTSQL